MMAKKFSSFSDFYPYYLSQHSNTTCRYLHYVGSILVLSLVVFSIYQQNYKLLWLTPVVGYGFAWFGHFFFEKNKPATFNYPLYSLMGDWVMLWDWIRKKKV